MSSAFAGRRSPHGERGLKFRHLIKLLHMLQSLPTRGAWIEIFPRPRLNLERFCRSPHGERGLKCDLVDINLQSSGRSPHGERGLKSQTEYTVPRLKLSLPTRGAWIEIASIFDGKDVKSSLPTRGAWIEILFIQLLIENSPSLPTRGAWIEMPMNSFQCTQVRVAPHTGSVD